MTKEIPLSKAYKFLINNKLIHSNISNTIRATDKGRRLLDYLGILHDYHSAMTYEKVYGVIPQEHKDAVELVRDRKMIKKKTVQFSWIHIIIIPIQYNDGTFIPERIIADLKNEFISHFGGNTRIPATGEYISQYQGLQSDKCQIWSGFGTNDNYKEDIKFMESLAEKAGSQKYCNQEAITIADHKVDIKILDTFDMSKEIELLCQQSLFNLRVMILLAGIAGTEVLYDNTSRVRTFAFNLGFIRFN